MLPRVKYALLQIIESKVFLEECTNFTKQKLKNDFDCLLTQVATSKQRSLKANLSVGLKILKTQTLDGIPWELIY